LTRGEKITRTAQNNEDNNKKNRFKTKNLLPNGRRKKRLSAKLASLPPAVFIQL
jgi:hypothetical protein